MTTHQMRRRLKTLSRKASEQKLKPEVSTMSYRNLAKRMQPITPTPECECWPAGLVWDWDGDADGEPDEIVYNPECPAHGQAVTE